MSLETYAVAADLYLARGQDVNSSRPAFTGDVFASVPIPGVQDSGMAIIVAHPCTMRGPQARMRERVLVAAVREHVPVLREAWRKGYYGLMPLPELINGNLHVGQFDELGKALTVDLTTDKRVACLSEYGVNLLQQRLIWHLTRLEAEPVKPDETSVYDAFCAASPLGVAFGSLIQATVGSSGGSGLRCRKRAGFVVYAASSVSWRWARISAAVPKWTDAGV